MVLPIIDSVKVNKYNLYFDIYCCKKVTPHPSDKRVVCNNLICKHRMFVSQSKKAINAELLLTDKEDYTKQITVTLIDPTI